MTIEQLRGRCSRLKQELARCCASSPSHRAWIDRLGQDLIATEREIATLLPHPEKSQRNSSPQVAHDHRPVHPSKSRPVSPRAGDAAQRDRRSFLQKFLAFSGLPTSSSGSWPRLSESVVIRNRWVLSRHD